MQQLKKIEQLAPILTIINCMQYNDSKTIYIHDRTAIPNAAQGPDLNLLILPVKSRKATIVPGHSSSPAHDRNC